MIESIAISHVATHDKQPKVLDGLHPFNFIIGETYTDGFLTLGIDSQQAP